MIHIQLATKIQVNKLVLALKKKKTRIIILKKKKRKESRQTNACKKKKNISKNLLARKSKTKTF
jgi:hypothetical protein